MNDNDAAVRDYYSGKRLGEISQHIRTFAIAGSWVALALTIVGIFTSPIVSLTAFTVACCSSMLIFAAMMMLNRAIRKLERAKRIFDNE